MKQLCLSLFALSFLVHATSSAQIPPYSEEEVVQPCLPFLLKNLIERPPATSTEYGDWSDMGRSLILDITGDGDSDLVFVAGDVCIFNPKPSTYDAPQVVTFPDQTQLTGVLDIAPLRDYGPGGSDAFLATTAAGLILVEYENDAFKAPTTITAPLFAGAAPLYAADLDGDDNAEVFAASGTSVVVLPATAGGFGTNYSMSMAYTVVDVVPVQWNATTPLEFAILTDGGVVIRELNGTPIGLFQHATGGNPNSNGTIARVQGQFPTFEAVAWTRRSSPGIAELILLGGDGMLNLGNLSLAGCDSMLALEPTVMVSNDYDGNLTTDLVLMEKNKSVAVILRNTGVFPYFHLDSLTTYDVLEFAGLTQFGIPSLDQIDGWGPKDLVFLNSSQEEVSVFTELSFVFAQAVNLGAPKPNKIAKKDSEWDHVPGEFRFAMRVLPKIQTRTHLEVILWKAEANPSGETELDSTSVKHYMFDLVMNGGIAAPWQYATILGMDALEVWAPGTYFFIEYRFLQWNGSSASFATPWYVGGLALKDPNSSAGNYYSYLTGLGSLGSFEFTADAGVSAASSGDSHGFGDSTGRVNVGAFVTLANGLDFPEGENPIVGDLAPDVPEVYEYSGPVL